jgi:peptide/nickel transport system substrate-binding protein
VEPDGISTRFKLRKGVQFHDGWGEFTAADVVFTHGQIIRDDSLHSISRRYKLATIEVINDHEIVFKLSRANAEALKQISEQVGGLEIESAANFASTGLPDLTTSPLAGTGAYQFMERIQGQKLVFEAVPYTHWRYTPDFPELEYRWMGEASTRLAALLTEEIHLTQLPEDSIPQAEAEGMRLITGALSGQRVFLGFKGGYLDTDSSCGYVHCDSPWLDRNVRQALNRAIDRDELNTAFFGDKGQKMVMNHIPPTASYWNTDWDRDFEANWGYDPDAARALLAESGYDKDNPLEVGVEITTHAQYGQSADVLEIIAGYWDEIGVDAKLLTIDAAANRSNTRAFKYTDHVGFSATASFDIQGWRVYNSHVVPRGGALELIETGALIDKLQAEMVPAKQNVLLREIGDLAFGEYMGIYLYWIPAQLVINPEFVSSYNFPGSLSAIWTHYELLKAN